MSSADGGVTIREFCARTGHPTATVEVWCKNGRLGATKAYPVGQPRGVWIIPAEAQAPPPGAVGRPRGGNHEKAHTAASRGGARHGRKLAAMAPKRRRAAGAARRR